jgi:hypothetical protein
MIITTTKIQTKMQGRFSKRLKKGAFLFCFVAVVVLFLKLGQK